MKLINRGRGYVAILHADVAVDGVPQGIYASAGDVLLGRAVTIY